MGVPPLYPHQPRQNVAPEPQPLRADPEPAQAVHVARLRLADRLFSGCFALLVAFVLSPLLVAPLLPWLKGMGPTATGLVLVGCVITIATAVFRYRTHQVVRVGTDGVSISSRFRTRFVPFDRVETVGRGARGLGSHFVLALRGGEEVTLRADVLAPDDATALAGRLESELARRRARGGASSFKMVLSRAGRPIGEWRRSVRSFRLGAGGYRDDALTEADAAHALDDALAPADVRLGAALALATHAEGSARVRVAAGTVAHPRLRVALLAIADGHDDDASLEAALEQTAEPRRQRLPRSSS